MNTDRDSDGMACAMEQTPPCHAILDTMPNGLMTVDTDGHIRTWNRAMQKLTGYTADEVIGRSCSLLHCAACAPRGDGDHPFQCRLLNQAVHGSESDTLEGFECAVRTRDGSTVPVLKNARVLRHGGGDVVGIIETLTDLRPIRRLEQELEALRGAREGHVTPGRLIGSTEVMREVYERIHLAADSMATVLILGETGTGKELAAEAIHTGSSRHDRPFIKVNCSALPESLLESELFGHVKGAFTGATGDKIGRFEAAHGGTIFLDEIGDLSPLIQLKLLRVLQEREIERVGESLPRSVDVRVICATHRDLRALVDQHAFREDLYYRIRVFPIAIPPLRARKPDIPLLVDHFITRFSEHTGKAIAGVSNDVFHCLMDHCWPGNVRELENAIEHAFVTCQAGEIGLFDLPVEIRQADLRDAYCNRRRDEVPNLHQGTGETVPRPAREDLLRTLEACHWNRSETARRLNVDRTTVWRWMKRWAISPPE